jgi:LysM repeat protein
MKSTFLVLTSVLLATGCTTLQTQRRHEAEVRLVTELAATKERMQALEQRVEALETVREMTFRRLDELRGAADSLAAQGQRYDGELRAGLERERAERENMRAALVQTLSEKIAEVIKAQTPARQPPRVASGYEHVVKSGETLSEIARAYNVRIDAVLRANSISNPDSLKVGQTLFIPE